MAEPEIKRRKTFTLRLTRYELLHLRDLFGVILPTEMKVTLSQALALQQERVLVESKLWQKVAASCAEARLPLDEEAPDFTVAVSAPSAIGVFELTHDPLAQPEASQRADTFLGAGHDEDG